MKDNSLKLTLREMQAFLGLRKTLVGLASVSLLLGLIGPFQTFDHLRIGPRIVFWSITTFFTFIAGSFGVTFIDHLLSNRNINKAVQVFVGWLASGTLVSIVVFTINYFAFGQEIFVDGDMAELLGYCFVIALAVLLLVNYYTGGETNEAPSAPPKILTRINVALRAPLVSLSVSDHYVEVTTHKGKELVLIRLSDAIAETQGVHGLQIHRSHWIVLDQVASTARKDGKTIVTMQNGAIFPISRTYMQNAKEAGLV